MSVALLGTALCWLAAAAAAAACVSPRLRGVAGARLLGLASGALGAAAAFLVAAHLRCDFRLEYVAANTSLALPPAYRVAAMWAGQEGSVLLWALLLALVAWRLARARSDLEQRAAGVVAGLLAGMVCLLLVRGPFVVLPVPPADGRGLNPLLHNPWMCVHPPVLFAGYALLVAPFALAVVSLRQGDADGWLAPCRRYLLAGWVYLGAGMMLGGYWAYITLGWGGFWAWDPVENASLIPWLVATAMLHSLAVQARSGAMSRLNLALATAVAAAIMYGSYLTRSGVLSGASVHNFESIGEDYNAVWLGLLLAPAAVGWGLLWLRRRAIVEPPIPPRWAWLAYGAWLLLAMAGVVLVGTSMPLVRLWTGTQDAVDVGFYNQTQSLLFCLVAVALIAQMKPAGARLRGAIGLGMLLGLVAAQMLLTADLAAKDRIGLQVLCASAGGMVVLGLGRAAEGWRVGQRRGFGTGLAHAGMALLVLGAVLSGPGQRVGHVEVAEGASADVLGLTVSLAAVEPTDDGLRLLLTAGGASATAEVRQTSHGELRTPGVVHRLWGDVYLEPVTLEQSAGRRLVLTRGEPQDVEGARLTFVAYEMGGSHGADGMSLGARLRLEVGGKGTDAVPGYSVSAGGGGHGEPVALGRYEVRLVGILADQHAVEVELTSEGDATSETKVTVQVSRKPSIGWVWLGTWLCLGGGAWCLWGPDARRAASNGKGQET